MNCQSKVSALVSVPELPLQFDRILAKRTADDLLLLLAGYLPAGSVDWLAWHRPDVARFLDEAEAEMHAAVFAGDQRRFVEAVVSCTSMHLRAAEVYAKELARSLRLTYSSAHIEIVARQVPTKNRRKRERNIGLGITG